MAFFADLFLGRRKKKQVFGEVDLVKEEEMSKPGEGRSN